MTAPGVLLSWKEVERRRRWMKGKIRGCRSRCRAGITGRGRFLRWRGRRFFVGSGFARGGRSKYQRRGGWGCLILRGGAGGLRGGEQGGVARRLPLVGPSRPPVVP